MFQKVLALVEGQLFVVEGSEHAEWDDEAVLHNQQVCFLLLEYLPVIHRG